MSFRVLKLIAFLGSIWECFGNTLLCMDNKWSNLQANSQCKSMKTLNLPNNVRGEHCKKKYNLLKKLQKCL